MTENDFYQLKSLGDPHNFGKTTFLRSDGRIVKPRNTAWERAFLSSRSPLRQKLDLIGRAAGLPVPLANLTYWPLVSGGSAVDALIIEPVNVLTARDIEATGVLMAIAAWFGITDLNAENIVCGRDKKGNLVLSPIDLETVLIPLSVLDDTDLVGHQNSGQQSAGLTPIRHLIDSSPIENGPSILVGSFSSYLCLLQQHRHELAMAIGLLLQEPIRIRLRASDIYRIEIKSEPGKNNLSANLLAEEKLQLIRGDIPYFFSTPNKDQLFWFDTGESMKPVDFSDRRVTGIAQKLPVWPGITTQKDFSSLMRQCIQDAISYLWQGALLHSTYSGIVISNGPDGLHIKSDGRYLPVAIA